MSLPLNEIPSPSYVIDERLLELNLQKLAYIQVNTKCQIILALKAFSTYHVFPLIKQYLAGATASSLFEAELAHEYFGKSLHIYSPGYREEEMDRLCELSQHLTFNSFNQLNKYRQKCLDKGVQVGLRLNPEFSEVSIPIYDPCAPHSRLGVTLTELEKVDLGHVDGFHFHTLCGKHVDSLERTLEQFEEKFSPYLDQVKWVNFGGGHGLTYDGYDLDRLCKLISEFQARHNVQVILEPGEGVVYKTGFLVASVLDILHNEKDIAILDTSATAHMPDVLEMPYRPEILGSGKPGELKHTYRLGGMTCLSGDVIGEYSFDQPLKEGDRLVFTDMSHYTMVKNTMFNGISLPSIVIIRQDGAVDVVRQFSFADFKSRL